MADTNDTPSLEQEINELVEKLADDTFDKTAVDPVKLFAATAEKRRRDTQSGYTKSQQELKKTQAIAAELSSNLEREIVAKLPEDKAAELEELKHQNPDEWHKELKKLEAAQSTAAKAKLEEIANTAVGKSELEVRQEQLAAFTEAYPDIAINDEVIENDIPPRITKQLAEGKIDFAGFLEACKDYLTKGKVLAKPDTPPNIPNLGAVPGSSSAQGERQTADAYDNEIY
jgi:uncharacterized protein YhaN